MLEARPSIRAGSPPITQPTFRTCRAHYPGGSEQVHLSVPSLPHAAFPILRAGRHPRFHFRGLLELHSCYGLPGCSPTKCRLCHEATWQAVTRSEEHTSELQSPCNLVCRLLLEKKKKNRRSHTAYIRTALTQLHSC